MLLRLFGLGCCWMGILTGTALLNSVANLKRIKIKLPTSSNKFSSFEQFCLKESQLFRHFYKTSISPPIIVPASAIPLITRLYPNLLYNFEFRFDGSSQVFYSTSYLYQIGKYLYTLKEEDGEIDKIFQAKSSKLILELKDENEIEDNYLEVEELAKSIPIPEPPVSVGLKELTAGLLQNIPKNKIPTLKEQSNKLKEQFMAGSSKFELQIWKEIQSHSLTLNLSIEQYLIVNLYLENVACNTIISPRFGIIRNFELDFPLSFHMKQFVEERRRDEYDCVSFTLALGCHTFTRSDGLSICLNSKKDGKQLENVDSSCDKPFITGTLLTRLVMEELPIGSEATIGVLLNYLNKYQILGSFFWSVRLSNNNCYVIQVDSTGVTVNPVDLFWIQGNFNVEKEENENTIKNWNEAFPGIEFDFEKGINFLQATVIPGAHLFTTIQTDNQLKMFQLPKDALE